MKEQVLALVDGNSFYCSCERVFNPRLNHRPVIVLSNNDGCAVALTPEAKALGIKMGSPYFKIRDFCERNGVAVFSSNYTLYGDMSRRLNDIYHGFAPEVEVYSIDESFLDITGIRCGDRSVYGHEIRDRARQWTGIPTCVGIGPTKTLAKLANRVAKKVPGLGGVCDFTDAKLREQHLPHTPVGDVWGVSGATSAKLESIGITTTGQLRSMSPRLARQMLTVVGERLVLELNGIPCMKLETQPAPRKGLAVTRGFSRPVTTLDEMQEAMATYATRASEKLRVSGMGVMRGHVFMHTSPFSGEPWVHSSRGFAAEEATDYTPEIIGLASAAVTQIWKSGIRWAKAGIVMTELGPMTTGQRALWGHKGKERQTRLMTALDQVNRRYGRGTLVPAASGMRKPWGTKFEMRSNRFSTEWDELPSVQG